MSRSILKISTSGSSILVPGESLGGPGIRAARRLLASARATRVVVLERSWEAVDRSRLLLTGPVDDQISVRHVAASPLLMRPHRPRHVA